MIRVEYSMPKRIFFNHILSPTCAPQLVVILRNSLYSSPLLRLKTSVTNRVLDHYYRDTFVKHAAAF